MRAQMAKAQHLDNDVLGSLAAAGALECGYGVLRGELRVPADVANRPVTLSADKRRPNRNTSRGCRAIRKMATKWLVLDGVPPWSTWRSTSTRSPRDLFLRRQLMFP